MTEQTIKCVICGKELTPKQIKRGNGVCSRHCANVKRYQNVEERQKTSNSQKQRYLDPIERLKTSIATKEACSCDNIKQRRSNVQKIAQNIPEVRQKKSESLIKHYQNPENRQRQSRLSKRAYQNPEVKLKEYQTKKTNGTLNISTEELQVEELLHQVFDDTQSQYYSERYPYICDFYIPSLDLFIELNFHWTHGHKSYNENDKSCIEQLKVWQEKAKTSNYYSNAIRIWTERDIQKLQCAIDNNLNYRVFYNYNEFKEWLSKSITR